jgi:hypothetical protein
MDLSIDVTFFGAFSGSRNVYGGVQDQDLDESGWSQIGAWTVP